MESNRGSIGTYVIESNGTIKLTGLKESQDLAHGTATAVRPFMARWLIMASGLAMGATNSSTAGKWGRSQMKAGIPSREGVPVFHFKGQYDGRDQEYAILFWPMLGQGESHSAVPTST